MQQSQAPTRSLLTALEVQELLHIDRSTVYRMAQDGRLPSIRVGRTWRFSADEIGALLTAGPATPLAETPANPVAQAAIEVAAELLGVMMVVTDMNGQPLTDIANPCPWFTEHAADPQVLASCVAEWKTLAGQSDFTPTFRTGSVGFQCARTFIRNGSQLVGMVLAGGISPTANTNIDPNLYHLDDAARQRVLSALPKIAATITSQTHQTVGESPKPPGDNSKENQ